MLRIKEIVNAASKKIKQLNVDFDFTNYVSQLSIALKSEINSRKPSVM